MRQARLGRVVSDDAQRVLTKAAVVLEVSPRGKVVRRVSNAKPAIGTLAIIGRDRVGQQLLMEIGIGRTRPYHPCRQPGLRKWMSARCPGGTVTSVQYAALSAKIFLELQAISDARAGNWKPHNIPMGRAYYTRRNGLATSRVERVMPRGIRFSIAKRDHMLLADFYWLQIYESEKYRSMVRFVDKLLGAYRGERGIMRRPYVVWLHDELKARASSTWPRYLLSELPNFLPGERHNRRFQLLVDIVERVTGWQGGKTPERRLADTAQDPKGRLNGIKVRDISGLRADATKDHVVFELFPNQEKKHARWTA